MDEKESYTSEEVRRILNDVSEIEAEMDDIRSNARPYFNGDKSTLVLAPLYGAIGDLVDKMKKHPEIFSAHIAHYESIPKGLSSEIDHCASSYLERMFDQEFELWPKQPTDQEERLPKNPSTSSATPDDGDDDLPF